jgi:hypothetical protein
MPDQALPLSGTLDLLIVRAVPLWVNALSAQPGEL